MKAVRMMSRGRKRRDATAGRVEHLDSMRGMEQHVVLQVNEPWDTDQECRIPLRIYEQELGCWILG